MKQQNKMTFVTKALVLLLFCSMFCMCSGSSSESEPVESLWLLVNPNSLEFSAEQGESQYVEISTNGEWYIDKNGIPDWVTLSPTKGSGTSTISVTTNSRNEDEYWDRQGRITIKAKKSNGAMTASDEREEGLFVMQTAMQKAEIDASPSSLNFSAEGGSTNSKTITVKSNTSWTVNSNQSWCTVSPSSGSYNGTVEVTVQKNTSSSVRSASIIVMEGKSGKTVTVSVSQESGFSHSIGRDEYDADKRL